MIFFPVVSAETLGLKIPSGFPPQILLQKWHIEMLGHKQILLPVIRVGGGELQVFPFHGIPSDFMAF
jgi:hypothetical protein